MPPEKPKNDKPAAPAAPDPFVELVSWIVGALVVLFLLNGLVRTVTSSGVFSRGLSGFTPQGIVLGHTRPIASLLNPFEARVVALHDLTVYNDAGGKQIGTQKFNARGRILQGPVLVGGVNYYYVDFDTGQDGWVSEKDIGYLESEPTIFEQALLWVFSAVVIARIISILLSVLVFLFLLSVVRRLTALRQEEQKKLYPENLPPASAPINPHWERVEQHIESLNENDWRLAILEADIMLNDLLDTMGLPGDTIGEKLQAVEKSEFITVDNAWEAHKVRNQIAHEGADFLLNQREARRIIDLYRTVFEEFHMIG